MIARGQVYKCEVCGNIVEVLHAGGGELVCCGQPMNLLEEKSGDDGTEKHTPVIVAQDNGVLVKVGEVPHPMEENHFIEWIEVVTKERTYREYLAPGQAPEASFPIKVDDIVMAREYCSVHGLWKSA